MSEQTFTVTNTDTSADVAGSLAWAVAQANAYAGACSIAFDSSLEEQSITLAADLLLTNSEAVIVPLEGLSLSAPAKAHSFATSFNAEGGTLTVLNSYSSSETTIGAAGMSIALTNIYFESSMTTTTYVTIAGNVTMNGGGILNNDVSISGALTGDNITIAQSGGSYGHDITVKAGGVLRLTNSSITMAQNGDDFIVNKGGKVYMTDCDLSIQGEVCVKQGGSLTLVNTDLHAPDNALEFYSEGTVVLKNLNVAADSELTCQKTNSFTAENVSFGSGTTITTSTSSHFSLKDCTFEQGSSKSTLNIARGDSAVVTVTNCDLSQVSLKITGDAAAGIVDLSGNYWGNGVDTLEEIISLISGYSSQGVIINDWLTAAPVVTAAPDTPATPFTPESGATVYTVTNTNATGTGSLAWAVEQADALNSACYICFDSQVYGQKITLPSDFALTNSEAVIVPIEGVSLSAPAKAHTFATSFNAVGETLTVLNAYSSSETTIGAAGKSITLSNLYFQSTQATATYATVVGNVTMNGGGILNNDVSISGALTGDNITIAQSGSSYGHDITVKAGGILRLTNSSITMAQAGDDFIVNKGGKVYLTDCDLSIQGEVLVKQGGSLTLVNTDLHAPDNALEFYSEGTVILKNLDVASGGALTCQKTNSFTAETVSFGSGVTISTSTSSVFTLKDCTFKKGSSKSTLNIARGDSAVVTVTNCDLSQVTLKITGDAAAGIVDLSGNYWGNGVNTLEEIISLISGYSSQGVIINDWLTEAPVVTDAPDTPATPFTPESGATVYTVTNTNASGTGSLAWAVEQAENLNKACYVCFDSQVYGQKITLPSDFALTNSEAVIVPIEGVSLSAPAKAHTFATSFNAVGETLTVLNAYSSSETTIGAAGKSITLSNLYFQSTQATATYATVVGNVTMNGGGILNNDVSISGALTGDNITIAQSGSSYSHDITVKAGGILRLTNSSITMAQAGDDFIVNKGGKVYLTDCDLSIQGEVLVKQGGSLTLVNTDLHAPDNALEFYSEGTVILKNLDVASGGALTCQKTNSFTAENVSFGSGVTISTSTSSVFTLKDCTFKQGSSTSKLNIARGDSAVVTVTNCDLSQVTLNITGDVAAGIVDLSGNYWGKDYDTLEEITSLIEMYKGLGVIINDWLTEAPAVTEAPDSPATPFSPETGATVYTVTNTNASGTGSFAWAVEQADALNTACYICFDSQVYGQKITLPSDFALTNSEAVIVPIEGVSLSAPAKAHTFATSFNAVGEPLTVLNGYSSSETTIGAAGKSITLSNLYFQSTQATATYATVVGNVTMNGGGILNNDVSISGALTGDNITIAQSGSSYSHDVSVKAGGILRLTNSSITMAQAGDDFIVYNGGKVYLTDCDLSIQGEVLVKQGGSLTLVNTDLHAPDNALEFYSEGTVILKNLDVASGGVLSCQKTNSFTAENVSFGSGVTISTSTSSQFTLKDCTFKQGSSTSKLNIARGDSAVVTLTNCDLSQVSLNITGDAAAGIVDLSGNYWGKGVDTLEEIASLINGYSSQGIIINDWLTEEPIFTEAPDMPSTPFSPEAGAIVYTVTNTNASGTGSLALAVEQADALNTACYICFDSQVYGQKITLPSDFALTNSEAVIVPIEGVSLSAPAKAHTFATSFNAVGEPLMVLNSYSSADTTIGASGKSITLSNLYFQSTLATTTYVTIVGDVTMNGGGIRNNSVTISGTLSGDNIVIAQSGGSYGHDIIVKDGGILSLTNSSITMAQSGDDFIVNSGGAVYLTDCDLSIQGEVLVKQGGSLTLENTDLHSPDNTLEFYSAGTAILKNLDVASGSVLTCQETNSFTAENVSFGSGTTIKTSSSSTISLERCTFKPGSASSAVNITLGDSAAVTMRNCDLSYVSLNLSGDASSAVVDLSGNYWGEGVDTLEEIIALIGGYDENHVVIDNWYTINPLTEFLLSSTDARNGCVNASDTSLRLMFTQPVDASSLSADSIRLFDAAGQEIAVTCQVEGMDIIVQWDKLNSEGQYSLFISDELMDITGKHFINNSGEEAACTLRYDVTMPRLLHHEPQDDVSGKLNTLVLYFSEAMDEEFILKYLDIETTDGSIVHPTAVSKVGTNVYSITIPEQTVLGTYTIRLGENVVDLAGNAVQGTPSLTLSLQEIKLRVESATLPESMACGNKVSVSWSGLNESGSALQGGWTDGVYLSRDGVWDINDIKLGEVQRASLAAGEVYTSTLSVDMPGVAAGEYYILIRPDIKGQKVEDQTDASSAQNLLALPVSVTIPSIALGENMQGTLSPEDAVDYIMIGRAGADTASLELSGLNAGDSVELFIAAGRVATRDDYDVRYVVGRDSGKIVLPEYALMQDVYLMVARKQGATEIAYELVTQREPLAITAVQSTTRNVAQNCQLIISGCNFAQDARVILVGEDGTEYEAADVLWVNAAELKVEFAAGTFEEGSYDIKVISGAETACGQNLVTMDGASGSNLRVGISSNTPNLGNHILTTFEISYENTGYDAMEAAIITFTISQNGEERAFLTLDGSLTDYGFWTYNRPAGFTSSVSFLATDGGGLLMPTGRDDTMLPESTSGLANSISVYYAGWQKPWDYSYPPFELSYSVLDSSNTTPIDWNAILDEAGVDGSMKETLSASLQEAIGTTWGQYVKTLNQIASQLDDLGVDTTSMGTDDLLGMILKQAMGIYTPSGTLAQSVDASVTTGGLALNVSRFYASDLVSPGIKGIFGYGWQSNWDIALAEDTEGDVHISIGGTELTLQKSLTGGYVGAGKDDDMYLRKLRNGSFVLQVKNGTTSTFSAGGKLLSQVDEYGNTLEYSYDTAGNLVRVTHSSGGWLRFTYNTAGFVSSVTNSYGETTLYSYDSSGNLVGAQDYRGQTVEYGYGANHVLTSITGSDGTTQVLGYGSDGLFSSTHINSADGGITGYASSTIEYLSPGVVKVTDAYSASSTYYYDGDGNLLQAKDAYGNLIRYSYNELGQLSSVMYQDGSITTYRYDDNGNVIATTDARGATVSTLYDEESRLLSVTDAMGHTQSYTYDSLDRVSSIQYEDGTVESWTYDAQGNMASWTQQDGTQFTYTYDKVGNLLTQTSSEGSVWTYTYNAKDVLVSSSVTMASGNSSSSTTYTYDERDLLIRMEQDGHSVSYTYDDKLRCSSMVDEQGNTTSYSYDALGRLTAVSNGASELIRYEYDNIGGRLLKETKSNGTSTAYTYTLTGQVESITNYAANGKTVQSSYCYSYNKVGLVESLVTHEGSWAYEYDAIGQLTHSVFTPVAGSSAKAQDMLYEYDLAGNRTRSVINGVETLYETDAMNRTTQAGGTSYEYDTNGNLILEIAADGSTTTHEYDELNKLVSTTTSKGDVYTYSYDAAGNRISMTKNGVATHYSYDAGGNLINEYDAEGSQKVHYNYGNNLIGYEEANQYYHTQGDLLGSVTGVTDASGNLVQTGSWDSFGNELEASGSTTDASLVGWLGSWGLTTDEDGKTYMRARYYDAALGKFTTSDPIGINGGLNTYAYCSNNGVSCIDPLGLWTFAVEPVFDVGLGVTGSVSGGIVIGSGGGLGFTQSTSISAATSASVGASAGLQFTWSFDGRVETGVSISGEAEFSVDKKWTKFGIDVSAIVNHKGERSYVLTVKPKFFDRMKTFNPPKKSFVTKASGLTENKTATIGDLCRKIWSDIKSFVTSSGNLASYDPNDLTGTLGYGDENFIAAGTTIDFKLECENDAEATAPARWVRLQKVIDEAYDIDTFELTSIVFAGNLITLNEGQSSFNKTVEWETEGGKVTVEIEISLDRETRELYASFMAIDPETAFMLQDVTKGILYPEAGYGNGQGYITYSMELKKDLATGTKVSSQADIYFDFNDVIPTPELNYTIDSGTPESRMLSAETQKDGTVLLTWEAADAAGGSGIASSHIYVAKKGGALTYWKSFSAGETSAVFSGDIGDYDFAILSVDNTGLVEAKELVAEVSGTVEELDITPPSAAEGLFALTDGSNAALAWNEVEDTGFVSYRVQYVTEGSSWETAPTLEVGSTPELLLANLADGLYAWRVQAVDASGNASAWSEGASFRIDTVAPELPAPTTSPQVQGQEVSFSWAAASDASAVLYGLRYKLADAGDDSWTSVATEETSLTLSKLAEGSYVAEICALDAAGNMSEWKSLGSFTVDVTAPTLSLNEPALSKAGEGKVTAILSWAGEAGAHYTVMVDGVQKYSGSATSCTLTLADGEHNYSVTATDAAGNSATMSGSFSYDATAPTLSLNEPSLSKAGEGMVAATLSWAGEAGASYTVMVDGELKYSGTDTRCTLTLPEGEHNYSVTATDAAGNSTSRDGSFSFDETAPTLSLNEPALSKAGEGKVTAILSWVGEAGASYTVLVDGEQAYSGSATSCTLTLADGEHNYSVTATDAAGNSSTQSGSFTYDATAPTLSLNEPSLSKAGEETVTATLSWAGEAGASYTVMVDGELRYSGTDTRCTLTLPEGEHSYSVTATDASGNSTSRNGSFSFDAVAPDLSLAKPTLSKAGEGKVQVTLCWVSEAGVSYIVLVDGEQAYSGSATSCTLTLADGAHSYEVTVLDATGDSTTMSGSFTYDATAPTLSLKEPSLSKAGEGLVTATLSWEGEAGARYTVMVDGVQKYSGTQSGCTLTLADGAHSYSVTATDAAGNSATQSGSFSYDATAPTLSLNTPEIEALDDERIRVSLSWKCSEAAATYTLTVNGRTYTPTGSGYTLELPAGKYSYSLTATDAAGNSTTQSGSFRHEAAAPAFTFATPVLKGSKGKTKVTFSWKGNKGAIYSLYVDGRLVKTTKSSKWSGTLVDGAHTYELVATEVDGSVSSLSGELYCDATAPNPVPNTPEVLKTGNGSSRVTLSWAGEEGATYSVKLGKDVIYTGSGSSCTVALLDGKYSYTINAVDSYGNKAKATKGKFTVDTTAPKITFKEPTTKTLSNGMQQTSFSWKGESKASYMLKVDGEVVYTGTKTSCKLQLTPGEHSYTVVATDQAGNSAETPDLILHSPSYFKVAESRVDATFSWEGESDCRYLLKVGSKKYDNLSGTSYTVLGLKDGKYKYSVTITDEAGNTATQSGTLVVDATAPKLTLKTPSLGSAYDGRVTAQLSWKGEKGASYTVTVAGQTYDVGTATSYSLTLPWGTQTYSVTAMDAAGNRTTQYGNFGTGRLATLVAQYAEEDVALSAADAAEASPLDHELALSAGSLSLSAAEGCACSCTLAGCGDTLSSLSLQGEKEKQQLAGLS